MSKEKQIEEIRKDVFAAFGGYEKWEEDWQSLAEAVYNAGYRKQSEWISVKDRLPEPYKTVLVFCRNGFNTFQSVSEMIDENGKRWSAVCGIPVTHWMPLPEAPKMKGDSDE